MADVAGEEDEWLYGENVNEDQIKIDPEVANKLIEEDNEDGDEPSSQSQRKEDDDNTDEPSGETGGTQDEGPDSKGEGDDGQEHSDGPGGSDEEDVDDEEDDDDDSDDDGVQVVIGDLKAAPGSLGAGSKRGGPPPDKKGKFSVEDFETPGTINGVSALEFNVDNLEDKPWRKPGADITDYFNYGFTEETWRAYCDRQKRIRFETGAILTNPMSKMHDGGEGAKPGQSNIAFPKKFGQQPYQRIPIKQEPQENTIQVRVVNTADRRDNFGRKGYDMPMVPPPFDLSVPPPQFRPEFMGPPPPEFFNRPPPGFYQEEMPGYEEQQWMDSQWEGGTGIGASSSVSVIPLTKVPLVPPPPGEADDPGSSRDRK